MKAGIAPLRRATADAARRLVRDRAGATAIEYGLIASCIVIVIIAAVTGYGDQINAQWNWLANTIMANVKSS